MVSGSSSGMKNAEFLYGSNVVDQKYAKVMEILSWNFAGGGFELSSQKQSVSRQCKMRCVDHDDDKGSRARHEKKSCCETKRRAQRLACNFQDKQTLCHSRMVVVSTKNLDSVMLIG